MTAPATYWSEAQALTRANADPNSDSTPATSGMSLKGVRGFRLCVYAAAGQTLSGGGNLRGWVYNPDVGLWMPNPELDKAVTSTKRGQAFPDFEICADPLLEHRVLFAADAITVSSGTVTVRIDAVYL